MSRMNPTIALIERMLQYQAIEATGQRLWFRTRYDHYPPKAGRRELLHPASRAARRRVWPDSAGNTA